MPGATADEPFLHVSMQSPQSGNPASLSRFLTGTADSCVADMLVAPLGSETCTTSCCPIADPAYGYTNAQYHYDELMRRGQDLESLVYGDCATLLGVDFLNASITAAAH